MYLRFSSCLIVRQLLTLPIFLFWPQRDTLDYFCAFQQAAGKPSGVPDTEMGRLEIGSRKAIEEKPRSGRKH